MIKNKDKFISLTTINGGKLTFGDNAKGKGKVGGCHIALLMMFHC